MREIRVLIAVALAILSQTYVFLDPGRGGAGGRFWLCVLKFKNEIFITTLIGLLGWLVLTWQEDQKRDDANRLIAANFAMIACWLLLGALSVYGVNQIAGPKFVSAYLSYRNEAFITFLTAGIAAALWEEVFFRGVLQKWFQESIGKSFGIALVVVLFSITHREPDGTLYFMAIALGVSYAASKSLIPGVAAHAFYNLMAALCNSAAKSLPPGTDLEKLAAAAIVYGYLIFIPLSLFLSAAVYWLTGRHFKKSS